jgi:hypothetical protein
VHPDRCRRCRAAAESAMADRQGVVPARHRGGLADSLTDGIVASRRQDACSAARQGATAREQTGPSDESGNVACFQVRRQDVPRPAQPLSVAALQERLFGPAPSDGAELPGVLRMRESRRCVEQRAQPSNQQVQHPFAPQSKAVRQSARHRQKPRERQDARRPPVRQPP